MRQQQQQQQQSQQPQDDDSRGDSDDVGSVGVGGEGGLSSSPRSLRSQTSHPILIPPIKVHIHTPVIHLPHAYIDIYFNMHTFNNGLLTYLLIFPVSSPLYLLLSCLHPQSVSFPGLRLDLGLAESSSEASHVVPGA